MRLLVTGASGFLGAHVVTAAKGQFETFAAFFSRPVACGVQVDIRDEAMVRRVMAEVRPDAVIHTAYDKADTGAHSAIILGSANVAAAAQAQGARLIHMSTDVVFGGTRGWYREYDGPDPVTDYGKAKAAAEQAVLLAAPEALLIRTSLIYGLAGDDPHSRFVLDGASAGLPVTLFVDEYRCPIFVGDLAQALLELVSLDVRGPLHVAGAERMSRYEFGTLIARYHGVSTQTLVATTPEGVGILRPKDCSLDSSRAQALLRTRLRGARETLDYR
jgi:dTDP-4-dehydrorhamnose reductase